MKTGHLVSNFSMSMGWSSLSTHVKRFSLLGIGKFEDQLWILVNGKIWVTNTNAAGRAYLRRHPQLVLLKRFD